MLSNQPLKNFSQTSALSITFRIFLVFLISTSLLSGCFILNNNKKTQDTPDQENIAEGITQEKITSKAIDLLVVHVDPQKYTFQIFTNDQNTEKRLSLQEIRTKEKSPLVFNGSFFSTKYQPIGLLISSQKEIAPLQKANLLNGIFWLNQQNIPHLSNYSDYKEQSPSATFAIQAGPILLDSKGKSAISNNSNPKKSSRTAIGIDKNQQIVIIIIKQTLLNSENALSLFDFAQLIETSPELQPLQIHDLLNLDGGTSSGLATSKDYFPELEKVQNSVITIPLS